MNHSGAWPGLHQLKPAISCTVGEMWRVLRNDTWTFSYMRPLWVSFSREESVKLICWTAAQAVSLAHRLHRMFSTQLARVESILVPS